MRHTLGVPGPVGLKATCVNPTGIGPIRADLANAAREAVMAAILDEGGPETGLASMATGLRANLADVPELTAGERHLLEELLQRIALACG